MLTEDENEDDLSNCDTPKVPTKESGVVLQLLQLTETDEENHHDGDENVICEKKRASNEFPAQENKKQKAEANKE